MKFWLQIEFDLVLLIMSDNQKIISFQGSPGAYSDMACRSAYPGMKTIGYKSFSEAFESVRSGVA